MKTIALCLILALPLQGCATIERHPVITGAVVAIIATSIALSADSGTPGDPPSIPHTRRK